jgi:CRP-like cAMP-binding protein
MNLAKKETDKLFHSPIFRGIDSAHAIDVFERHNCRTVDFEDGDIILSQEITSHKAGIFLSGEAVATTADDSKNALLRFFGAGDLFGIANLFTNENYVSSIKAKKKCRVFFFTEEAIRELLETDKTFLYNYLGFLSGRICYLNRKIRYLTAGSAERRLALYLSSFQKETVELDASLSSLSELLDIGRSSLYRAFDTLIADGYIEKNGRTIRLLAPDAMTKDYQ